MIKNKFGEQVYNELDIFDFLMQGKQLVPMIVDESVQVDPIVWQTKLDLHTQSPDELSVQQFDQQNQNDWFMPDEYKQLDIAEHVLGLCKTDSELQRVGHELLLYQQKNLFNLLRYLKFLVDTMKENNIIWGVGRGSSVASYVLYLLEVHRIDSMHYDLSPEEFLR